MKLTSKATKRKGKFRQRTQRVLRVEDSDEVANDRVKSTRLNMEEKEKSNIHRISVLEKRTTSRTQRVFKQ